MIEAWVWITLAAAFAQNLRSLLQRRLTQRLSLQGAAYVRFVYALPLGLLLLFLVQPALPGLDVALGFVGYAAVGGIAQILGTFCLVAAVTRGNFAVGTALSKSEAAQAALFGLLVLGDQVSVNLAAGIGVSFIGVCLLLPSDSFVGLRGASARTFGLTFGAGLLAGTGFAVAAVCFRGASTSLPTGSVLERAALTLVTALVLQSLLHGLYIGWREPGQLRAVFGQWRSGLVIGCIGALASLGWFAAMTLVTAAKVRTLGQVEMIFTLLTSMVLLRERLRLREWLGLGLIVGGLLLLLQ